MSIPIPALRQPKCIGPVRNTNLSSTKQEFLILTLKTSSKLVVSSDSFHCIISVGNTYKCVVCKLSMELLNESKEKHKLSHGHQKLLKVHSYLEDLGENLVRQIDNTNCYCTICNVITSTNFLRRHIKTEVHVDELNRALLRATTYKPDVTKQQ